MIANTGTYIDSPFHRYQEGNDLAAFELDSIANLEGVVIRYVGAAERALESAAFPEMEFDVPAVDDRAITVEAISGFDVRDKAILFHTGWDMRWRTDDYANGKHPFLTESAAEFLAEAGAALVGIDSLNIDDTATGARPVHSTLLAHNIPIVEHLCGLRELPDQGFRFFAVPPKIRGFGSFPVRAFAIV